MRARLAWMASAWLLCCASLVAAQSRAMAASQASADMVEESPLGWATDAVRNEEKVIESADQVPLRYRQRRVGAKGDTTREVIESRDGNVARTVERDGRPLNEEEDAAEQARLKDVLSSPDDFLKHHRKDKDIRDSVIKLVGLMPEAMLYSFAPGQPQTTSDDGKQVVVDFKPNPTFHPPTMYAEALTGLEGRVWIDERSHYLTRIEARVLHPVNMGFGILAKIYPGGTLALEQKNVDGTHWVFTHIEEHLTARLLLVKNYPEDTVIRSWDFRTTPMLFSLQDGIRALLAMQVRLQ